MYKDDYQKILKVKEIIIRYYADNLTISALAKEVGLSETKLKTGFKEIFQISPHKFIIQERLNKAQKLLQDTQMQVSEIAVMVGYSSLSHFTYIFKNCIGVSPTDYRKSNF